MAKSSNVYSFTMNKGTFGNRLLIKAICIALTFTFGASLFATGLLAYTDCALKCCCQSKPMTPHPAMQEQTRPTVGCCAGYSQLPCDLASATELQLPEITLVFSAGHIPTSDGPAGNSVDPLLGRHNFRGPAYDQFGPKKFRSRPLYLQNLSFLI